MTGSATSTEPGGAGSRIYDFPFPREIAVELSPQMLYLQKNEPIAQIRLPSGGKVWLATRYDDVREILADRRFSIAAATAEDAPELTRRVKLYPGLLMLDPPLHTKLRGIFVRALRSQPDERVDALVQGSMDETLSTLAAGSLPVDLIDDFCKPMVTRFSAALVGVPERTIERFRTNFAVVLALGGVERADTYRAADELRAIASEMIRVRRKKPSSDVAGLIVTEFDAQEEPLPEDNLIGLVIQSMSATAFPVISQLSYAIMALLRHPDQWNLLRARPELLDSAVQECLRFIAPIEIDHLRIALEDVEVAGRFFPKGSVVATSVAAANLDEEKFQNPTEFDITRTDNRHLAFGHGVHRCPGSSVGTRMLTVVLHTLLQRVPNLHLVSPANQSNVLDRYNHVLLPGDVLIAW
ncbi:cytochrome P450 [Amycolatopsis sp. cmx-4-61]|uniref:cytochrome P450 n=1 Tax=Amycolatopsis sp. cmx-4-61 TaxID=2790937 RepID=UPI00397D79B7